MVQLPLLLVSLAQASSEVPPHRHRHRHRRIVPLTVTANRGSVAQQPTTMIPQRPVWCLRALRWGWGRVVTHGAHKRCRRCTRSSRQGRCWRRERRRYGNVKRRYRYGGRARIFHPSFIQHILSCSLSLDTSSRYSLSILCCYQQKVRESLAIGAVAGNAAGRPADDRRLGLGPINQSSPMQVTDLPPPPPQAQGQGQGQIQASVMEVEMLKAEVDRLKALLLETRQDRR